jgi:hypothetical protein
MTCFDIPPSRSLPAARITSRLPKSSHERRRDGPRAIDICDGCSSPAPWRPGSGHRDRGCKFITFGLDDSETVSISQEAIMASSKLSETLLGREVERLFNERPKQRGDLFMNPVTGWKFVFGVDPLGPQKKAAHRALLAREYFALYGPDDAPQLPIDVRDPDYVKWGAGPLDWLTAQYARSLVDNKYDVREHPSFAKYVSGLLWDHENVGGSQRASP